MLISMNAQHESMESPVLSPYEMLGTDHNVVSLRSSRVFLLCWARAVAPVKPQTTMKGNGLGISSGIDGLEGSFHRETMVETTACFA